MVYIYIGIGGFLGAVSRYAVGNLAKNAWAGSFPAGTFLVNLVGCFFLGFLMTLTLERLVINPNLRMGIATGFLGGLTTFSTYTYEALTLLNKGLWSTALWYIMLSVLAGITAAWLGVAAARAVPAFSQRAAQRGWATQGDPGD